jgi:hypothetical protein
MDPFRCCFAQTKFCFALSAALSLLTQKDVGCDEAAEVGFGSEKENELEDKVSESQNAIAFKNANSIEAFSVTSD